MEQPSDITMIMREIVRLYGYSQRNIAMNVSNMSRTDSHTIIIIGTAKAVTLNELAEKVGLEKSWMSRVVNSMVKDGWIVKSPNPLDGRSVLLTLSEKATILYHQLRTEIDTYTQELFKRIPTELQEQTFVSLMALLDALNEES